MIKNAIIYRIGSHWQTDDLEQFELALASNIYVPAAPSQDKSSGWAPPRGEEHGALVEAIGGQWILKFITETKTVPTALLNQKLKDYKARIERETGRRPGRKESKELKEGIRLELLPNAFPKVSSVGVWISPATNLMVLDAPSNIRADEAVTALVRSIDGLHVSLLDTKTSPGSAMANWLVSQEAPLGFDIGNECELRACDESKSVVRYGRHPLEIDEIKGHISHGKMPTRMALTWDDRVSFVLTEGGQMKKIAFHDVVFEEKSADDGGFDADVAIMTGELSAVIGDLVDAMGGVAA